MKKKAKIDSDWVTDKLVKLLDICLSPQEELGKNGERTGRFTYKTTEALKVLELMIKLLTGSSQTTDGTENLSSNDIAAITRAAQRILSRSESGG